jgi:hypothetical protein
LVITVKRLQWWRVLILAIAFPPLVLALLHLVLIGGVWFAAGRRGISQLVASFQYREALNATMHLATVMYVLLIPGALAALLVLRGQRLEIGPTELKRSGSLGLSRTAVLSVSNRGREVRAQLNWKRAHTRLLYAPSSADAARIASSSEANSDYQIPDPRVGGGGLVVSRNLISSSIFAPDAPR